MPSGTPDDARAIRPSLGTLLRGWRERALLTQEEVAARTGLNARTIRRLEADSLHRPRSASLRRLADVLGLDDGERTALKAAASGETPVEGDQPGDQPTVPRQLPADVPAFVGREDELALVGGGLSGTVAIEGMAGVGKTALAVHLGHAIAEHFPDGQLYVDLRGYDPGRSMSPATALGRLLRGLGMRAEYVPTDEDERAAAYRSLLAGKRALVVLDNARGAGQVQPLLPGTPGCLTVVTSRASLATLDCAVRLRLDVLSEREALTMLSRLAGRDRVKEQPEAAAALVRLCAMLPLAIRIAGARLTARPAWSIATLADLLADRARRLDELRVDARAVRAAFAVSHQALESSDDPVDRDAAEAFRLLGALDWIDMTLPVAAALFDLPQPQAREALERLVDDRLLDPATPGRYQIHDLLRLHTRDLAAELPPARRAAAVRRVVECCLAAADQANVLLNPATYHAPAETAGGFHGGFTLTTPADASAWIDAEHDNLVAVARQAADDLPEPVVRLTTVLNRPFDLRGYWQDLVELRGLAASIAHRSGDRRGEAFARQDLGWTYVRLGNAAREAIASTRRALAIWREAGERRPEQACLNILGFAHRQLAEYGEALTCLEQALTICRQIDHRYGEATTLDHLGLVYQRLRRFDEAIGCHRESLEITRQIDQRYGEATALGNLGLAHHRAGRSAEAVDFYLRSVAIAREVGDRYQEAESLWGLGQVHAALGDSALARDCWQQSATVLTELGALTDEAAQALLRQPIPRTPEIIQRNT